jgi:hypothetical protein
MRSNPGRHCGNPAINSLSYGKAQNRVRIQIEARMYSCGFSVLCLLVYVRAL